MHKLKEYPIAMDMFEHEEEYDDYCNTTVVYLEGLRQLYNETKDYAYFRKLKQALPESYLQKRTCTMNYENILNMVRQRANHRLKEWSDNFIAWAKTLPNAEDFLFI